MSSKILVIIGIVAALSLFCGCANAKLNMFSPKDKQKSLNGNNVIVNVSLENSGIYMFYFIPIVSGDTNKPNRDARSWFKNKVEDKFFYMMLENKTKEMKANKYEDITFTEENSGVWTLWLFRRRLKRANAVITKK